MLNYWMTLGSSTAALARESQEVIGMRLLKMAGGGPGALREAGMMIVEKSIAFGDAMLTLGTGGSSQTVVDEYRARVRANRSRLAAGQD